MSWYTFFLQVMNMSLTASIVILAVVLARLCLKRAPKVISYGLWAVVLFRLLCPVTIASDVSLLNFLDPSVKDAKVGNRLEYISIEGETVGNLPGTDDAAAVDSIEKSVNAVADHVEGSQITDSAQDSAVMNVEPTLDTRWLALAGVLWVLGIVLIFLYGSLSCYRLRRRLVGAVCLRDNIFLSDYNVSPFVMGLFRPKIYLPSSLGERERSYILLHEQYHIRRLDHVTKALAFLALSIHWFNPLVWLAFILFEKDMEMSCDEAVVKRMGEGIRADYSASLLGLATGRRIIAGIPLAFGEGDASGRIRNLAKWKRPAFWVVAVAVAGCVILAVGLLTNPREKESEQSTVSGSLTCNVKSKGINADIEPSYFPEDSDFNYDGLMRCVVMGDGTLTFTADWDTDELAVSHRNPGKEENAFYFIKGETGKYVLQIQFLAKNRQNKWKEYAEDSINTDYTYVLSDESSDLRYFEAQEEELEDPNKEFFHNFNN